MSSAVWILASRRHGRSSKISGGMRRHFGGIAIVRTRPTELARCVAVQYGRRLVSIGCESAPTDSSAIILPVDAQLRFVPVENYNGTPGGLNVRVADGAGQDISSNLTRHHLVGKSDLGHQRCPQTCADHDAYAHQPDFHRGRQCGQNTATAVKLLNSGDVFDLDLTTTPGLDPHIFGGHHRATDRRHRRGRQDGTGIGS